MLLSVCLLFLATSLASAAPAADPSPQLLWGSHQLTNPFALPNSNAFSNGLGIPNFMSNGLPSSFGAGYPNVGYSTGFNTGFTSPTSYSTQYSRRYSPGVGAGYDGGYGNYGGYQYGGYNGYNPSRNYNGYRNRYN